MIISTFLASASSVIGTSAAAACGNACNTTPLATIIGTITNTLVFLVGALAVVMIVVGGLRYVTSSGDAKRVEAAKNTITYAIAGVIVAILAYAIVHFIVQNIK